MRAFRNYRYFDLQEKYDFTVTDLNDDEPEEIELIDNNHRPWMVKVAKTILNSDYLISLAPIKTHNEVTFSGSIYNIVSGSLTKTTGNYKSFAERIKLVRSNQAALHQNLSVTHENIKRLYNTIPLKLSVLDAYEAMQGDGPISGEMVPAHFAIASSDPIAADWLACQLIGVNIDNVGYLSILEAEEEIKSDYFVNGDNWKNFLLNFKMHKDFEKIRHWK